jgi:hypothetical protein
MLAPMRKRSPSSHVPFEACTIAARNYLPRIRVLASSFARHHRNIRMTALLIDDEDRRVADDDEPFRCWRLEDIGLDRDEIARLGGCYDILELSTAIKPRLLRRLIEESRRPVIYLDPDIKVFNTLEEAVRLARDRSIVLTPHTIAPYPRDGRNVDELNILAAGVYNLGFIGVSPARLDFLDWWWERTRRDAFVDPGRMRFTDQRWVDFVPGMFEHAILKDPGYNVAYWNLHARRVIRKNSKYYVNRRPLRFFHYSGFDPTRAELLSKHQGDNPRILLPQHPAVARLCREYVKDLARATGAEQTLPYGWGRMPDGPPVDRHMRSLFREGLVEAEHSGLAEPPGPFHSEGPAAFLEWLRAPAGDGLPPWMSRYLLRIYADRLDVRQAFPDLRNRDATAFREWVHEYGTREEHIPAELLPATEETAHGTEEDPSRQATGLHPESSV